MDLQKNIKKFQNDKKKRINSWSKPSTKFSIEQKNEKNSNLKTRKLALEDFFKKNKIPLKKHVINDWKNKYFSNQKCKKNTFDEPVFLSTIKKKNILEPTSSNNLFYEKQMNWLKMRWKKIENFQKVKYDFLVNFCKKENCKRNSSNKSYKKEPNTCNLDTKNNVATKKEKSLKENEIFQKIYKYILEKK